MRRWLGRFPSVRRLPSCVRSPWRAWLWGRSPRRRRCGRKWNKLEHDPEKWRPVFGMDHAQAKRVIWNLPMAIAYLANPTRFLAFANRTIPWLGGLAVIAFAFGINQAILAPDDYQQGATVKIMFLHVPGAWLGMLGWGVMTIAALGTLVWRHPLADVAAKATAPIGAAFTLMCLVTGSLWGRPMWGTYWVWDARLTSVLLLFLLYLGVIALWRTVEDPSRAARAAAILTLVGAIDLPIIKFSVDWWNTLHQPASVF